MRQTWLLAASLAAVSIVAAPAVRADDVAPPSGKGQTDRPGAADPKKDEPVLRVERAKQIVKDLEDAVARARAAQPVDVQLLQPLLLALEQAKALAKPAKPDELTGDEKKAVVDEAKKQAGDDPAAKGPGGDWAEKQMAKAFDGADLNEEEQLKASKIIGDWFKEWQAAWGAGDSKKQSDLKRKRDDDLEKAIGHKKANKVINNLNAMRPGRGG